jgi:hypothetical protein
MKRLIILVLALFPLTAALADKPDFLPMKYYRDYGWGPAPFINCHDVGMDFWIWVEGATADEGKMFFDKDGTPLRTVSAYYTIDAFTWVPADPGCNVAPFTECMNPYPVMAGTNTHSVDRNQGRGEHSQAIYRNWIWVEEIQDWYPTWGQLSGLNLRIGIPGYGNIFANAGHMTHELAFDPDTGAPYWSVISMTPNWEHQKTKDVFAMCSYHGNQ